MRRIFLAIAALLVLTPVLADDTPVASMPYSKLVDFPKHFDALLKDLDQLKVSVRLTCKDPKVKLSDITLEAKLKSGQVVSIPIATDGTFTVPSSPELVQEDPLFLSNQPKGTMDIFVGFDIKTPVVTAQRYADLMRGMTQVDMAVKRQGVFQGPKAHGLLFAFDEGEHTLTLHTAKGNKVFGSESWEQARKHLEVMQLPDDGKSTYIYLPMDDDLMDENPQTVFDVLPARVILAI